MFSLYDPFKHKFMTLFLYTDILFIIVQLLSRFYNNFLLPFSQNFTTLRCLIFLLYVGPNSPP